MTRIAVALLLAFAVGLAACGADGGTNPTPTNTDQEGAPNMDTQDGPPSVSGEPTVTASGLQIIDIEVGTGEAAEPGASVTVHYTGWLADGTKFDSSLDGGEPITFPLAGVIQGWQEGIPGMKESGKRRLIIPSELAYGEQGRGSIPPNAELTFDVELIAVETD